MKKKLYYFLLKKLNIIVTRLSNWSNHFTENLPPIK